MKEHEILNIEENASEVEIKKAYKIKAKQFHPDMGGTNEEFIQLKWARDKLLTPVFETTYGNNFIVEDWRIGFKELYSLFSHYIKSQSNLWELNNRKWMIEKISREVKWARSKLNRMRNDYQKGILKQFNEKTFARFPMKLQIFLRNKKTMIQ